MSKSLKLTLFYIFSFLILSPLRGLKMEWLVFIFLPILAITYHFSFKNESKKKQLIALIPIAALYIFAFTINFQAWYLWLFEIIILVSSFYLIQSYKKLQISLLLIIVIIAYSSFFNYYKKNIIPLKWFAEGHQVLNKNLDIEILKNYSLIDNNNVEHSFLEITNNRLTYLTFSIPIFEPCDMQYQLINELSKTYETENSFKVVKIIDGRFSTKANYIKYAKNNSEETAYFDSTGKISEYFLKVRSYPSVALITNNKLYSISYGFGCENSKSFYTNKFIDTIKSEVKLILLDKNLVGN